MADTLADGTSGDQSAALLAQLEALEVAALFLADDRFRARLDDVELAVVTITRPFDIHRTLVVLLDNHGLARQSLDIGIADAETVTVRHRHVDGLDGAPCTGVVGVDHLDQLGA